MKRALNRSRSFIRAHDIRIAWTFLSLLGLGVYILIGVDAGFINEAQTVGLLAGFLLLIAAVIWSIVTLIDNHERKQQERERKKAERARREQRGW